LFGNPIGTIFREISVEVAGALGLKYLHDMDKSITDYIVKLKKAMIGGSSKWLRKDIKNL
jgi:hypothetical protein